MRNFYETTRFLYKSEGLLNMYKGISVLASGCMPAHALYFSVYELGKKYFDCGEDA